MISEKNCSFFAVKISLYNYRCPSLLYADTKVLEKEQNFVSDILTFIFNMERVLLQPANSFFKPAQKNQDINKVLLLLQDLGYESKKVSKSPVTKDRI